MKKLQTHFKNHPLKYHLLLPLIIFICLLLPIGKAITSNSNGMSGLPSDETSQYLKLLLNYSFGINPDDANITYIPYAAPPNVSGLIYLNKSLNFIFSHEHNVYAMANSASSMNRYSSSSYNPYDTTQPWWYNSELDSTPTAQNPTLQAIQNFFIAPETCNDVNCLSQAMVQQNMINDFIPTQTYLDELNTQVIPAGNLSLSSLLNPLQYDEQTQESAKKFIRYLTSELSFVQLDNDYSDLVEAAEAGDLAAAATLDDYTLQLLNFAANASVVNDSLNSLLASRVVNPETNKSQVQTEFDMVASRIDETGAWRSQLRDKSQKEVLEEIAELLAGQQYQSFLRSRENERTIALLSSLVALQQRINPPTLGY